MLFGRTSERSRASSHSAFLDATGRTPRWGSVARAAAGAMLVLHGLGHAVLLGRGAGAIESYAFARGWAFVSAAIAVVGFVSAGVGLLGARPLRAVWTGAAFIATLASVAALVTFGDADLGAGLLTDALVIVMIAHATFLSDPPAQVTPGSRLRRFARLARDVAGVGFAAYVALAVVSRPWNRTWGATAEEIAAPLPWDPPHRDPAFEINHVIRIAAPPERVWPWLVQIGQDRGGFYSYSTLENLAGAQVTNAATVHPEWQSLAPGDFVRAVPPTWAWGLFGERIGWTVKEVVPMRALVLEGWGMFVLLPQDDGTTRLLVRSKIADRAEPVWGAAISLATFELVHFAMERAMLRGIRDRAEGKR